MIRARELRKTFRRDNGDMVLALDSITIEAPDGALTALVGPDGAGKTTFIRLVAGLLRADAGTLEVLGIDVAAFRRPCRTAWGTCRNDSDCTRI